MTVSDSRQEPLLLEAEGTAIELLWVPAGSFEMGSPNDGYSEAPCHLVTIPRPFYMGKLPITQRQWVGVCGASPKHRMVLATNPLIALVGPTPAIFATS